MENMNINVSGMVCYLNHYLPSKQGLAVNFTIGFNGKVGHFD